jgi:hypothetical protein
VRLAGFSAIFYPAILLRRAGGMLNSSAALAHSARQSAHYLRSERWPRTRRAPRSRGDATTIVHRKLIISLAAQLHLPAVYGYREFVTSGGLICYGPDMVDQHRRAAAYVDRILKGEKPGDLPVQAPTKYELAINLKTAEAFGLHFSQLILARADEVIE